VPVACALVLVTAVSVLLRTDALQAGFWIDEGIAVGIASHGVGDIPALLRADGSPPLYYVLLHGWLALAGDGEAAARLLSLLFAAITVPVSWWAGSAIAGRRAAVVATAVAAGCPLLSYYAQEARMYTLVALLSLVAATAFALAFVRGRRRHLVTLAVALVLLLYTHTWGLFLAAALGAAWLFLWRAGRVRGRDGAMLAVAIGLAYAPWVPTLAFQVLHTGAPWSEPPSALVLGALLLPAALLARAASDAVRLLALVAATGVALAWLASQLEPAWSPRYLAVLYGPAVLAAACALARRPPWAVATVAVAAAGLLAVPLPAKSNARAVAVSAGVGLRPGDLVISTQPEQVPVLRRYLPAGVGYLTPLGPPADTRVMDWRDALPRLSAAGPPHVRLSPGRRIVLVTPVGVRSRAPWAHAVRRSTREWRAALRAEPRLRRLGATSRPVVGRFRSAVRAEIYVTRGGRSGRPSFRFPSVDPRSVGGGSGVRTVALVLTRSTFSLRRARR
jgi:mannosyltransferase